MEQKVLLYDANDVKIGETFIRRAAQLVKQQRAKWTDDTQTAIRFAADAQVIEEETSELFAASAKGINIALEDAGLVALAEKRIKERLRFVYHSVALVPGFVLIFIFTLLTANLFDGYVAMFFLAFTSGSWCTAYAIHAVQFLNKCKGAASSRGKEERKARRLAAEIALLKNELQI